MDLGKKPRKPIPSGLDSCGDLTENHDVNGIIVFRIRNGEIHDSSIRVFQRFRNRRGLIHVKSKMPIDKIRAGRFLDPARLLDTCEKLSLRVEERFPGSGLAALSRDLSAIAGATVCQVESANRPAVGLRIAAWILIGLGVGIVIELAGRLHTDWELGNPGEFIQAFQAAVESAVFLGAAVLFLLSWENRIKRRRILNYLHELRSVAHLVDMHQLPKTPDTIRFESQATFTPHSPIRVMTPYQLARYFGYCGEMLSLIGKLATLYVQNFPDPAVLQAVDQIEDLTSGLSSKIWQKSMLITHPGPAASSDNPSN